MGSWKSKQNSPRKKDFDKKKNRRQAKRPLIQIQEKSINIQFDFGLFQTIDFAVDGTQWTLVLRFEEKSLGFFGNSFEDFLVYHKDF